MKITSNIWFKFQNENFVIWSKSFKSNKKIVKNVSENLTPFTVSFAIVIIIITFQVVETGT